MDICVFANGVVIYLKDQGSIVEYVTNVVKQEERKMKTNEQKKESKAWGITSLVTGIISILLFLMPYFGLFLAIFAMVAYGVQKPKNGFATAGLVCGIIGTIINTITFIIFVFALMFLGI
jgi:hypothetical protein